MSRIIICENCKNEVESYGSSDICKKCYMKKFNKKHYEKNKEKIKKQTNKYYYDNHEERKRQKLEHQKTSEIYKNYQKKYFEENKEKLLKNNNDNYHKNKEKYNKNSYKKKKEKLKNNIEFKLKETLFSRMRMAIMNHHGIKDTSAIELLGADIKIVRKHLESQFKEGMSWKNHAITGWHIDHIIPCDSFDLINEKEQKKCFHYTNLQPLWYKENLLKKHYLSSVSNQ
jgi:hypothetical protein